MSSSLISIAPAALRTAVSAATGAHRVHPVKPVVTQAAQATEPTRYTAAKSEAPDSALYTNQGAPASTSSSYQTSRVDRRDSFNLEITTQQGDVATVSLFQKQSFGVSSTAVQSETRSSPNNAAQLTTYRQASLDVQYALQGDLTPQEAASVDALVKQINAVAQDFFAGDLEQAMHSAARIDISGNAETLSAYSFDLRTQETQRVAAVYANIDAATAPAAAPALADLQESTASAADGSRTSPRSGDFLKSLLAMLESMTRSAKDLLQGPAAASPEVSSPTVA
ncbi:hypothetical protein [Rhodoferax aquaticus]|uniref:DUF5610 domain-containing protein n=1 Tax=Rhodoferax aquaticus TaxID=2527691 RepID=A0A515EQV6_9BURK|nr:hypothetical protein [Rhodoferax aquaticus]QDL55043.1 hypothetical protein EXZ61_13190 [Rhodoferax aquaticus]